MLATAAPSRPLFMPTPAEGAAAERAIVVAAQRGADDAFSALVRIHQRRAYAIVRAIDPRWKRDAIGAEVIVRAAGTERLDVVASSQGFLSEGPAALHFGLGPAARVEELEVAWPDGTREAFPGGMSDRLVELRRGSGSMMK
jgi:hypothetical protein